MNRHLSSALFVLLCALQAAGSSSTLPNGAEFTSWEKPLHFSHTYYVNGQAKNADDSGPGTEQRPFRTISRAAQILMPGERVVIAEGVYREFVRPARGGTGPDAMISYEAAPGAKVIIKGSAVVAGYPAGVDRQNFTPITAFNKKRDSWIDAKCTNVHDGKEYRISLEQTPELDKIIPQTFGYVLNLYPRHPESKSLGPNGEACGAETRGLLKRASIIAGQLRYVGKETDRRWTEGEDISLLTFRPVEYSPRGKVSADEELREKINKRGVRKLIRATGLSQHTIEAIREGKSVRRATLKRLEAQLA